MPVVVTALSIAEFPDKEWNRCFPDALEDWGYYRATEIAGILGFEFRYFAIMQADRLIAVVPAFKTAYRLDTTLQGAARRVGLWVTAWFPRVAILPLACLGSPVGETCAVGFAPEVSEAEKPILLRRLIAAFEADAVAAGVWLQGIKDAPDAQNGLWAEALADRYQRMPSLPTALLDLPYSDLDAYLSSLSKATRKDMRRKQRANADQIRITYTRQIDSLLEPVTALYNQTRTRSDLQFEELGPEWFSNVLEAAGDRGGCFLYWVGDQLAAFNLVLHDKTRMIDKFLGLDATLGPAHDLYFISWLTNVHFCIERGISCYQSGQAEYGPKRRLGSRFAPNWIWFRHARPWINYILMRLVPLLRLDRYDPALAAILEPTP